MAGCLPFRDQGLRGGRNRRGVGGAVRIAGGHKFDGLVMVVDLLLLLHAARPHPERLRHEQKEDDRNQ